MGGMGNVMDIIKQMGQNEEMQGMMQQMMQNMGMGGRGRGMPDMGNMQNLMSQMGRGMPPGVGRGRGVMKIKRR